MIPGSERSPAEGNGYPPQYSGLENSMDCIAYGVTKSWTRLSEFHILYVGFPGGTVVKNPPANAGDTREAGSIPGSGRSLEEGMANHTSILVWRVP